MAEINLEDLMKAKRGDAAEAAPAEAPAALAETVARQVAQLTPEERQKVEAIKEKIDLTDARTALTFGAPAQKEIAPMTRPSRRDFSKRSPSLVGSRRRSGRKRRATTSSRRRSAASRRGLSRRVSR